MGVRPAGLARRSPARRQLVLMGRPGHESYRVRAPRKPSTSHLLALAVARLCPRGQGRGVTLCPSRGLAEPPCLLPGADAPVSTTAPGGQGRGRGTGIRGRRRRVAQARGAVTPHPFLPRSRQTAREWRPRRPGEVLGTLRRARPPRPRSLGSEGCLPRGPSADRTPPLGGAPRQAQYTTRTTAWELLSPRSPPASRAPPPSPAPPTARCLLPLHRRR